jgi:Skp family chaperone for outer membrane proteins
MKLVAECRRYAEEYRKLAATMSQPEEKQAFETMATAWESAADKREAQLLNKIDRHTGLASLQ